MDEQKSGSKNKSGEFHKTIVNGDYDKMNKLINNGVNIYKGTAENESPLHLALINQHSEIAAVLWNIYKTDLKFIEKSIQDDGDQFWTKKPILIVYGDENISSFMELYVEYQKCGDQLIVNKNNCVVFLLKRDNLRPEKVLCLTPKSETGKMLTIRMIKCCLQNGVLDLQAQSSYNCTLISATANAGAINIFLDLVNFGIDSDHTSIVIKAIQCGHAEFLEMFYRTFPTDMFEFFRTYCLRILSSNKWAVFKYYAEQLIAEKQFTWTEIVNYRLPFWDFTLLHFIIKADLIEIAVPLLEYEFNFNVKEVDEYYLLFYLKWNYNNPEPYRRIAMKIIERDPTQLESEDGVSYTICHKLVSALCLPDLVQLFTNYPDAKQIFFKRQTNVLTFIDYMISYKHFDTITYLLGNSNEHLNKDLLYAILNQLASTNNIDLFVYVMSLDDYDFTVPTTETEYPIVTALENHNLEIFNMIWSKVENDNLSHLFYDLLRCAIQKPEYNELFQKILNKCADLENIQGRNKSLFHWSAITDNLYAATELIKRGVLIELEYTEGPVCDILLPTYYANTVEMYKILDTHTLEVDRFSQQLENQFTPLHNCMARQPSDETLTLIEYLIENGCDIDEEDANGRSCIYYANYPEIATCLLKYGPSLNCIDENGNTPIHYAFINDRPNVAYVLLEDGSVDYSIENNDRWSYLRCLATEEYDYGSLQIFLSNTNSKFRAYLIDHCNDSFKHGSPIIFGSLQSNTILSNLLLDQPNLNLFVHDLYTRNTILHIAMLYERVDTVDILIDRGLKINEENVGGDTPLNAYCRFSAEICENVLKRYLKHNPDVRIKNKRGMSPILYVPSKDENGEAVCELLAHGASLMDIDPETNARAFDKLTVRLQEMFKFLLDK